MVAKDPLEVGVGGGVASLGVHAFEEIAVVVVAEAHAVVETVAQAALRRGRGPQEREGEAVAALDGTAVDDVENGGHAVAIGGVESAWREKEVVDKVGIDDAHALLLAAADELRTVDFNAIDIDKVLVERTATDRILGGEFVVGADIRQSFDECFNPLVGADGMFDFLYVDLGECGGTDVVVGDHHLIELGGEGQKGDVEGAVFFGGKFQVKLLRLVACASDAEGDGVGRLDRDAVEATDIGNGAIRSLGIGDPHIGILHRLALGIGHTALQNPLRQ
jgi:hypothetical protein